MIQRVRRGSDNDVWDGDRAGQRDVNGGDQNGGDPSGGDPSGGDPSGGDPSGDDEVAGQACGSAGGARDSAYRDSSGRALEDYPRPSMAVDTALLTVGRSPGESPTGSGRLVLLVLQVRRAHGGWALPGTFLHPGERLIDAVHRSLWDKAGVTGLAPRQLRVFDDPERDERGWVLSAAHVDVVRLDRLTPAVDGDRVRLVRTAAPGRLSYDHTEIVALAVQDLRRRYSSAPDPGQLIGKTFTVRELRLVHEAVAGDRLQKDTFRRQMASQLAATGRMSTGTRGRPAELFGRALARTGVDWPSG